MDKPKKPTGSDLYPGFSGAVAPNSNRTQRLEQGSQRIQRGILRPTSGNFVRLPAAALATQLNSTQVVNLTHSSVQKKGGVSVHGVSGTFAWTATATSITWYWDGTNGSQVPVIKRADGTFFTVPTSGSGLTISGLAVTTDFYFLPFWNVNSLCNIGWVQGTTGSPQIAFTLADTTGVNAAIYTMNQSLQGNEPLSSAFIKATTGGGGGGEPTCVMAGTDIVPLGDSSYSIEVIPETEWVHLRLADGRELYCTYDHPLYHAKEGRVTADSLQADSKVITDIGEQSLVGVEFTRRVCSKHCVHMDTGHLFWANGFLSHNQKINT
jgi:hypothetical protein